MAFILHSSQCVIQFALNALAIRTSVKRAKYGQRKRVSRLIAALKILYKNHSERENHLRDYPKPLVEADVKPQVSRVFTFGAGQRREMRTK